MDVFEKCGLDNVTDSMQGHSLSQTIDNIKVLKLLRPFERNKLLIKKEDSVISYHSWLNKKKKAQSSRSSVQEKSIRATVKKLIDTYECNDENVEICKISQQFALVSDAANFYEHKPHQAMIASYITTSKVKVASIQVDYGHGKTYVILLAAYRMIEQGESRVHIIVLDEALVKQMNDSITMLGLPSHKIKVSHFKNLPQDLNCPIFVDEAYDIFLKSPAKFNKAGDLQGMLGLMVKAKRTILMSGVKCNQMQSLLEAIVPKEWVWKEFGSTNKLINQTDIPLCTVHCDIDFGKVVQQAISDAESKSKQGPVICFGFEDHFSDINVADGVTKL